jgi:hypothetical protein
MTPLPDPHPDEHRLQAVFDRTAEQPTTAQLTKLAARAADVPARSRRFRWPVWVLGPSLAAAAAVIALFAWPRSSEEGSDPFAMRPNPAVSMTERSPLVPGTVSRELPSDDDVFGGATAMFTGDLDDFDPLGGSLEGPESDDELDAWLAAADEILGGG